MSIRDRIHKDLNELTVEEKNRMFEQIRELMRNREKKEPVLKEVMENYLGREFPGFKHLIDLLLKECYDYLFSLGKLEQYLRNPKVTDINTFGLHIMYVEDGIKKDDPEGFINEEALRIVIERIMNQGGTDISESEPSRDIELYDGSRATVTIQPESEDTYISIRKHNMSESTLDELIPGMDCLDQIADYLKDKVLARKNIAIFGTTGVGKTTLVNALAQYIQPHHIIAILEDTREINLENHKYARYFKTRRGTDSLKAISYIDILEDCLRMFPDRIILTEIRTAQAAYSYIQATGTGHPGSMTTFHANRVYEGLLRLEMLLQEAAPNVSYINIKKMIANAFNVICSAYPVENKDGSRIEKRVLSEVVEVCGVAGGDYVLNYRLGQPQKIGELLLQKDKITLHQLTKALTYQEKFSGQLGEILVGNKWCSKNDIEEVLDRQVKINDISIEVGA